ncbi:hypothetical protein IAI10_05655 [Clostridium sp. 19966]|uniref:cohesin domain-containing protein n=1 Tax=Clostridium sp. 19966 TaxID=2768166 RepID=UPI0028DEEA61|nr:cohesin domain-containing protein [Clostridium sp. 19966]MDT8716133.1 hypothetical protein [Clostridium sp. 19966]
MKLRITVLALILLMIFGISASADEQTKLQVKVIGKVEQGQDIQISIYANNIKNLFAEDIKFQFDPSFLKITSVEKGDLIDNSKLSIYEKKSYPGDGGNGADNLARYIFTCLGKVDGFSGNGNIVIIKANVLKAGNLKVCFNSGKNTTDDKNLSVGIYDKDVKDIQYVSEDYGTDQSNDTKQGSSPITSNSSSSYDDNNSTATNSNNAGNSSNADAGNTSDTSNKSGDNNSKQDNSKASSNDSDKNTSNGTANTSTSKSDNSLKVSSSDKTKLPENKKLNSTNAENKTKFTIIGLIFITIAITAALIIYKRKKSTSK